MSASIRSYLEFYRDLGIEEVFIDPASAPAEVVPDSGPAAESALQVIRDDIGDCTRCPLHAGRRTIVFGSGNPAAKLVFVGEGPGADEDEQGLPFVGRAGQLLTKMIDGTAERIGAAGAAAGRLHLQRRQVSPAPEPDARSRRDGGVRSVPRTADQGDTAYGDLRARRDSCQGAAPAQSRHHEAAWELAGMGRDPCDADLPPLLSLTRVQPGGETAGIRGSERRSSITSTADC